MWLRDYGEAIEADLAREYPDPRDDLLEFYRGTMSPRRLWVLVNQLPPNSATVNLAQRQDTQQPDRPSNVRYLEDIPKVSLRDAQRFVNASSEEFSSMAGQAG